MKNTRSTSPASPDNSKIKKHKVNWHEAASCAIQIELRDYENVLEFINEYVLGKNNYRIDMLIIKKLTTESIPKNIACSFRLYNIFEFKGVGSSINTDSFYKTVGYAANLIIQMNQTKQPNKTQQITALDVTITLLSFHYPRDLMRHLKSECKLIVKKSSPGIYYVNIAMFFVQIIVTKELPSGENLFLRCMTNKLRDGELIKRLADDYEKHKDQEIYTKYMKQIIRANKSAKGESVMIVCEELFELYGTTSQEFYDRGKQDAANLYLPKIDELQATNEELSSSNKHLSSQIDYLKGLLKQHNIAFSPEDVVNPDGDFQ